MWATKTEITAQECARKRFEHACLQISVYACICFFGFIFSCPVDKYLNYKSADTPFQRFSFSAFQIKDAQVMYLHCEVYVCAKDTNSSRCAEGCKQDSGGSRRRRDETGENKQQKGVTSLGPVKVLLDRILQLPPEQGKISSRPLAVCFSLEVCVVVTRSEKLGRGGLGPDEISARGLHEERVRRETHMDAPNLSRTQTRLVHAPNRSRSYP